MSLGFLKSKAYSNIYYKVDSDELMILLLYVDALFLKGEDNPINECKNKLHADFEMKYLGMMHYFLGLEVWQYPDEIFLNQGKICSRNPKEIWDDRLQGYDYSNDNKFEAIE